jgi:hypothetical protein
MATCTVARVGKPLLAGELDRAMGISGRELQQEARRAAVEKGWLTVEDAPRRGKRYLLTEAGRERVRLSQTTVS